MEVPVIVTKSSCHVLPAHLVPLPHPRGAPSSSQSSAVPFGISVEIQTKLLLGSGFHPISTCCSKGKGTLPASVLTFPHSAALMNRLHEFSWLSSGSPGLSPCVHRPPQTPWNSVPKKTETQAYFLCMVPIRNKSCLLLLINSLSFQQESTLSVCVVHTQTHTYTYSWKCSYFQNTINRRTHRSGQLQSGPPMSGEMTRVTGMKFEFSPHQRK